MNLEICERDVVAIRFCGDSGDGMQLVGDHFTNASAMMGDEVCTLPDYPSEIRAPAGTIYGVSGFQMCFGNREIYTPGDQVDVLVAMNPAALKVNLPTLKKSGVLIVNEDAFVPKNLEKAGFANNPLLGDGLSQFKVLKVGMVKQVQQALAGGTLTPKQIERCKNFFALGLTYRLFNRSKDYSVKWMERKFKSKPDVLQANRKALEAGWNFGESGSAFSTSYVIRKKGTKRESGNYRHVTGNTAAAFGLMAAAKKAGLKLFLGSYPITPATDIMHELSKFPKLATVFQAEDEIAAIGATLGASFGGALAATNTSGPGFSLKSEFINLAVMVELPLVIIDVQRAGPSTGLPTKTEQSDLMQALWGRHGESPIVVLATSSPKDCFFTMLEASKIALRYMTPVIVLSDGYLGNGAEVWRIPSLSELPEIAVSQRTNPEAFQPYERDEETLARSWVIPGTAGLEHRIGGLEKEDKTGKVSHSGENHEKMVKLRAEKIARVAQDIPPLTVYGDPNAKLLVLGWGSTRGVIRQAVQKLWEEEGLAVACAHLRHLNPFPSNLKDILEQYPIILIPENNTGQLWYKLRAEYLLDAEKFNKIQGTPFTEDEIATKIKNILKGGNEK